MKKIVSILILLHLVSTNTYAQDIQLTDYNFTYGKRMLDGYSYVALSNAYYYIANKYEGIETNILKPNGTTLLQPEMYSIDYSFGSDGYYSYPQSESGNYFIAHLLIRPFENELVNNEKKETLINSDGKQIVGFGSVGFCDNKLFCCYNEGSPYDTISKEGFVYTTTGEKFEIINNRKINYISDILYNEDNQEFAVIYIKNKDKKKADYKATIEFYIESKKIGNYNGVVIEKLKNYHFENDDLFYDGQILQFKNKIYSRLYAQNAIPIDLSGNDSTYVQMNYETEESESERVDKSYTFKEKEINGTKYYALFKELKDGETATDFAPTEQPTAKYTEYIDQMYKKGLLFNNEMCFYKRGITRLDFGIVLGRAYCDAARYNIDEFKTDTKFTDVNNPYCLYLSDNCILTSSDALGYNLYLNEKEITKKDVSDALDKAAEKCDVLTEWSNIKVIQPTDAVCSRELAYVETFRLYELIKQHNDSNYMAFQPSQVLDSDSEAEIIHYETVTYAGTADKKINTEITTQGVMQNNLSDNSTKIITIFSIIGGVIAVLLGIIIVIKR